MQSCPVCGGPGPFAGVESYTDPVGGLTYQMRRCPSCEVVFSDPFKHPGAEWYAKFSSSDSYEGLGHWRFDWIRSLDFRRGGRLLDVGCGAGHFVEAARVMGYAAEGVDPNPNAVAGARQRGLTVHHGSWDDMKGSEAYDVVTMLDVFEHMEDPRGVLSRAREILKPGGGLILTLPNDLRPTPFGRDAFDYPPHHLTRWTPKALERFLESNGFEVKRGWYTCFPTWEFSRFPIAWLQDRILSLAKLLLYGRADKTLSEMAAEKPAAIPLPEKRTRTAIVMRLQVILGWLLAPFFLPMNLYYRLTIPRVGVTCCVLAIKK